VNILMASACLPCSQYQAFQKRRARLWDWFKKLSTRSSACPLTTVEQLAGFRELVGLCNRNRGNHETGTSNAICGSGAARTSRSLCYTLEFQGLSLLI
jgi:hypothetical protein